MYNDYKSNQNQSSNSKDTIRSPYNFVPLSNEVVFPGWAEQVSHDVPFEDGISGKIKLTVKLKSPAYIKNSGENENCFFKANIGIDGKEKYIIPGTSFKGMIRNVVEIASFSKMQLQRLSKPERKYSVRDLNNRELYTSKLVNKVKAGWLRLLDDGTWEIFPCRYARIEQEDLEYLFGDKQMARDEKDGTIKKKYDDLEIHPHTNVWIAPKGADNETLYRPEISIERKEGFKEGTLVFTGQPTPRQYPDKDGRISFRKHLEFVFYDYDVNAAPPSLPVSPEKEEDFKFIHSVCKDGSNKVTDSDSWAFWKEKLNEGLDVPVFYLAKDNKTLDSFGLAMMYRLPYDYSIKDLMARNFKKHLDSKADFAELIFGYTNDDSDKKKEKSSLKGRVQFSHFIDNGDISKGKSEEYILGGPKPTYYPNYIEQSVDANGNVRRYSTFMDSNAKIRGWKIYPSQENQDPFKFRVEKSSVTTSIEPLLEGTFTGYMRFFNLKPEELGVLLWSLDFGGNKDCQHKIGMGKPFGFGRISVFLDEISYLAENNDPDHEIKFVKDEEFISSFCKKYCSKFAEYMRDKNYGKIEDWGEDNEQIKELLAMVNIKKCWPLNLVKYPSLDNKDFSTYKNKGRRLERYSAFEAQFAAENERRIAEQKQLEEVKQRQEAAAAKTAAALEDLPDELKGIFEMLSNLGSSEFKEKLKNLDDEVKKKLEMLPLDKWKAGHRKVIEKLREKRQKKQ